MTDGTSKIDENDLFEDLADEGFQTSAGSNDKEVTVTPGRLRHIISVSEEYTRQVCLNRVTYPDPETFDRLTPEDVRRLGFSRKIESKRSRQAKSRGKQPKQMQKRVLPDPEVVAEKVAAHFANCALAGDDGQLVIGEWNMEFLDSSKAKYFHKAYKSAIPYHHLILACEVSADGIKTVANLCGYQYWCSKENNRNQAVGFLAHHRLQIVGEPISYDDVAEVQGIPNLRPAFRVDLVDTLDGSKHSFVVVHLKSMRGGAKSTAPVRRRQCQILAEQLGVDFSGTIGGDFNTVLDESTDIEPLTEQEFLLLDRCSSEATHIQGSRLDGFFLRNCSGNHMLAVRSFWEDPYVRRHLSDHSLLSDSGSLCGCNEKFASSPVDISEGASTISLEIESFD